MCLLLMGIIRVLESMFPVLCVCLIQLESLDGLTSLPKLEELYAHRNELVSIPLCMVPHTTHLFALFVYTVADTLSSWSCFLKI